MASIVSPSTNSLSLTSAQGVLRLHSSANRSIKFDLTFSCPPSAFPISVTTPSINSRFTPGGGGGICRKSSRVTSVACVGIVRLYGIQGRWWRKRVNHGRYPRSPRGPPLRLSRRSLFVGHGPDGSEAGSLRRREDAAGPSVIVPQDTRAGYS